MTSIQIIGIPSYGQGIILTGGAEAGHFLKLRRSHPATLTFQFGQWAFLPCFSVCAGAACCWAGQPGRCSCARNTGCRAVRCSCSPASAVSPAATPDSQGAGVPGRRRFSPPERPRLGSDQSRLTSVRGRRSRHTSYQLPPPPPPAPRQVARPVQPTPRRPWGSPGGQGRGRSTVSAAQVGRWADRVVRTPWAPSCSQSRPARRRWLPFQERNVVRAEGQLSLDV